jgi:hypothetical protein
MKNLPSTPAEDISGAIFFIKKPLLAYFFDE